jgi:hypothetical protein
MILGWLFSGEKRLPAVERRCFAVGEGELRVDGWSKKEELSAVAVQGKTRRDDWFDSLCRLGSFLCG